jgi:hypothetical protein
VSAAALLDQTRRDGLELIAHDGRLKVRGPASAVQKWAPILAANKPDILATLTAPISNDLEHLLRRAGTYWEYSPEDYEIVRDLARRDPEGLRRALESDRWIASPLQPALAAAGDGPDGLEGPLFAPAYAGPAAVHQAAHPGLTGFRAAVGLPGAVR